MQESKKTVEDILKGDSIEQKLALFRFSVSEPDEVIVLKFNIWARFFFAKYFKKPDAGWHDDIDTYNTQVYKHTIDSFTDIVFRGGAKTTRTKLFVAFVILNDKEHYQKYFKVLTKDLTNSKQTVTDIYNMFVSPKIKEYYPHIFEKSDYKREETMHTFTTADGIKVIAGTVGTDQRGQLQEDTRPGFIWFDDFETRKTLRSAVESQAIFDNMEEARTGLDHERGGCIYTCNYLSERGNVHKLVQKSNDANKVLIVPIRDAQGNPTWYHSKEHVEAIEAVADDFAGEYLCEPSAGADVYFNRENLKTMEKRAPVRTIGGFKIFHTYNPSHRYASGHDISGGVGLDSSTSVFIDFDTIPYKVVATYKTNTVKPDDFAYEIAAQGDRYGECLVAPEKNNHGHATIAILKQNYSNIFFTQPKDTKVDTKTPQPKEYGWHTNTQTKQKMMTSLRSAVDSGLLELTDEDLIQEAMSYSRDDLMDNDEDVRLTTRHFDLLIACAIAFEMREHATYEKKQTDEEIAEIVHNENDMDWHERFGII